MRFTAFFLLAVSCGNCQNATDEDFHVYRDPPRLLLTPQRLRLLQREHDRDSARWMQLDALVSGGAAMPESGFAYALYYRTSGDAAVGRKAVEWALGNATDLRQLALVFDWCGSLLNQAQADQLAAKLQSGMSIAGTDVRAQAARAFAAVALADRLPDQGDSVLRDIVVKWWRGQIIPTLQAGKPSISRDQRYALYELLHVLRDNLKIDLRESAPEYFKNFPLNHLMGHYPAAFPSAENAYRIPAYLRDGDPNLNEAALSRAASFAMVAYDTNAEQTQYLQSWLIEDRYQLRSAFGAPYEFLWANPYQPGLNLDHVPMISYDAATGQVFGRTSWDDDASWVGYFDGQIQLFQNGRRQTIRQGSEAKPLRVGAATLATAANPNAAKFHVNTELLLILGLAPQAEYAVEIDDEELEFDRADAGGTLAITLPEGVELGVRIQKR